MSRLPITSAVLLSMALAVIRLDAQTATISGSGGQVTTVPDGTAGISITANASYPDVKVSLGSGTPGVFAPLRILGTNNPGLAVATDAVQNKFLLGIATVGHAFMDGAAINDVVLRADGGGKILFSTSPTGQTKDLALHGGKVGIGTLTPAEILTVEKGDAPAFLALSGAAGKHTSVGLGRMAMEARVGIAALPVGQYAVNADPGDAVLRVDDPLKRLHFLAGSGHAVMTITNANVGIGVAAPTAPLQIATSNAANFPASFKPLPDNAPGILLDMSANGRIDVAGLKVGGDGTPQVQSGGSTKLFLNPNNNTVVIGLDAPNNVNGRLEVKGNIDVTGSINAKYQDLAEWVPSTSALAPGTVVVLDSAHSNHVVASLRAYDTAVAGVVSAKPGIALGEAGDSKSLVATTGRVRVRVDASEQPISIGDLLVTSDKPGVAMKSVPLDLQGIALHRPGTVLGKALEPLPRGEGEILVLLSLQ